MSKCYQFKGVSVLKHGYDVLHKFNELYNHLFFNKELSSEWRIPEWINKFKESDFERLEDIRTYIVYHDCGKPKCISFDDKGRKHFYNHDIYSYLTFKEYCNNDFIANLILLDMTVHKKDMEELFLNSKYAKILLLVGLCELHANAEMFGGINSDSFKIKLKRLNKNGKRIFRCS